jgi:hypothetical protein
MSKPRRYVTLRKKSRRGAIIILVAVCMTILLVGAAISLDGGSLLDLRRKTQATADAAAIAAAEDLFRHYPANHGYDSCGTAASRAETIAAANGFVCSCDGPTNVTVRTAPDKYLGGPHQGETVPAGFAEVTIQYNQPRYFSSIVGSGSIPVTARAVARGKWSPAFVGIHVLDLHEPSALRATGGGTGLITGGAAVIVNSDDPSAAVTTGGSTIKADTFSVVGGTTGSGFIGDMNTGMEPQPDPLRNLPEPEASDYTTQSNSPKHYSNGNKTLQPGVYKGGITITGQANVTMQPGVYYMNGGGFSFSGQGNLSAQGVMIYNDPKGPSDGISLSGSNGGNVTLTPPTSGPYKGMTLFQERTATNLMNISGNGGFYVTGTFYTANGPMNVTGNGEAHIGSQYISRMLDINGTGNLTIDYNPDKVIPRRVLGLVE